MTEWVTPKVRRNGGALTTMLKFIRTAQLLIVATLVAGCGGEETQPHEDAGPGNDPAQNAGDPDAGDDGGSMDAEGGDASCAVPCGDVCCATGEICCTDEHGHFPTCVAGSVCP